MIYPKRQLILTFAAVVLAGCALHFLYGWQPNAATALFSPVNESLWEHVKLVFWPYLGAAFLLNRGRPGGIRRWPWAGCTTSLWGARPCGWISLFTSW